VFFGPTVVRAKPVVLDRVRAVKTTKIYDSRSRNRPILKTQQSHFETPGLARTTVGPKNTGRTGWRFTELYQCWRLRDLIL